MKKNWRKIGIYRLKKIAINAEEKQKREISASEKLFHLASWKQAKLIAITLSQPFEVDTSVLIQAAWDQGKQVAIPKTSDNHQMAFYLYDETTKLKKTTFGVLEPVAGQAVSPEEIDLLIVPGVIFSHAGYRIGFGGGFYDRYLANYFGETISLVFAELIEDDWQPDLFDLPVKQLIIIE